MRNDLREDPAESARPLPAAIDGFDIVRELATGGMGTVYEARQRRPDRLVALKLLKHAAVSRSAMRRFEFETHALAQLEHPGIATIFHAGTHDDGSGGVPYFVMELVRDARDITQYCDEEQCSHRERLQLFAEVCDAVHHGHQKRIIHRDLKPSNILVNADGQAKIIDFGIALSTDTDLTATTLTNAGHIIGTLAYMSPEQCGATTSQIDTTTDVYALGVVLYELLCDRLPYEIEGKTHTQVARTIEEQPPTPPSAVRRELRGNLDAIVLKALSKDQRRRYLSAAEFAEDIRRHLRREPITARPPSPWQKTARWMGRHPVMTTAAACVTIVVLTLSATYFAVTYQLNQPQLAAMGPGRRYASVYSAGGRIMRTWTVPEAGNISGIEMADGVGEYTGDKLVVIGFRPDPRTPHPGALVAYNANRSLDEPIWSIRISNSDLPQRIIEAGHIAQQFGIQSMFAANVFDDVPGDELIVVHGHMLSSWRCLRIYELTEGALLFQLWHDGSIARPQWLAAHELIVTAGDNKEVDWTKRGVDLDAYPIVCFAIQPILDHIETDCFRTTPPFDSPCIRWYKALMPPDAAAVAVSAVVSRPFETEDASDFIRYSIHDQTEIRDRSISWLVRFDGTFLANSAEMDEDYRLAFEQGRMPDQRQFHLAPLPPVLPEYLLEQATGIQGSTDPAAKGAEKNLRNE